MTASIVMEHPSLSEVTSSPGQKRKRASESGSPDSRRNKRGAPATMTAPEPDAFLEIAQAAHDQVNPDDFSALAQATAEHNDPTDTANASSTAAAALSMYPTLHVPQTTEETFAAQASVETHHDENSFSTSIPQPDGLPSLAAPSPLQAPNGVQIPELQRYGNAPNSKPAVGSEEWHKMRKDNHKEVERRRRETINEGINELAKIVPGCEKNKGSILQKAVAFITQLKENESQNIEKWTLEKLLTEQAINELSTSLEKCKGEIDRLCHERDEWKTLAEEWKALAQSAGLQLPQQKVEPGSSS
ncbi:hypothetical protein QBC37DRAFT_26730 [Rhypophila decipiens]|uniref:BHLH domain-containing protein n=1 Tax=Rhypophila decipiens TaxID=261697 RepID=A0AAN6YKR6_9PEZI|nr:hypothetical protein QBC37DRAFT_26730 [Rhypophila decipiens]